MKTKSNKVQNIARNLHNLFEPQRLNGKKYTQDALHWLLEIGHFYATMTRISAIRIARVHQKTFERWEDGKSEAPLATLELLRLHAFGEPPSSMNNEWRGWRFQNGALKSNDFVYEIKPHELQAVIYWQPLANKLAIKNASLEWRLKEMMSALEPIKTPQLRLVI